MIVESPKFVYCNEKELDMKVIEEKQYLVTIVILSTKIVKFKITTAKNERMPNSEEYYFHDILGVEIFEEHNEVIKINIFSKFYEALDKVKTSGMCCCKTKVDPKQRTL